MALTIKTRTRRTILVVEDALTTRCILEQFFARAGCDVLQAGDPDTAMMRLRSAAIDAVILDLRLSNERSGLEVLEQMRLDERFDDVPVVVLTGVTEVDPEEQDLIRRHGAHLLYKRFGYRDVVQRLEKIITEVAA
ncbi:MAG TPA: response regulator [Vicinamibacterales bacterium]|nr:response regulator [Vicinamibacterales bacterium]